MRSLVLIRKNSYGNGSEKRVQTQAVLMIIMRGHNHAQILVAALKSMSAQDTSRLYRQKARQMAEWLPLLKQRCVPGQTGRHARQGEADPCSAWW